MAYQIRDLSATRKECMIDYPKSEMEVHFKQKLQSIKGQVQVPGFRKGHAPIAMVERQYTGTIIQELLDEKIQSNWTEVCKVETVLERPAIEVTPKIGRLQDLASDIKITLSFDVYPQFTLVPVDQLAATIGFTPEQEEAITAEKRQSYRTVLSLECSKAEDVQRPAARGDKVTVLVEYTATGKKEDDLTLILDETQTQEEFIAKIEGMSVGETRSFEYTPAEYNPDLEIAANTTVAITVTMKLVQALTRPSTKELCEYVQDLRNVPEADQEAKLAEWIDNSINMLGVQERFRKNERQLKKSLLKHYGFEVPSIHTRDQNFASAERKSAAEDTARLNYIFGAYSEHVNMVASPEEIDMVAKLFAQDLGMPLQYMSYILESNKQLRDRFQEMLSEKILVLRLLAACGADVPTGTATGTADAHKHEHKHEECSEHCTHHHD